MRLPVSHIVVYSKGAKKIFLILIPFDLRYVQSDILKFQANAVHGLAYLLNV